MVRKTYVLPALRHSLVQSPPDSKCPRGLLLLAHSPTPPPRTAPGQAECKNWQAGDRCSNPSFTDSCSHWAKILHRGLMFLYKKWDAPSTPTLHIPRGDRPGAGWQRPKEIMCVERSGFQPGVGGRQGQRDPSLELHRCDSRTQKGCCAAHLRDRQLTPSIPSAQPRSPDVRITSQLEFSERL